MAFIKITSVQLSPYPRRYYSKLLPAISMKNATIIKRVSIFERAQYLAHLLRLDAEDRYLRFGRNVKDDFIKEFVSQISLIKEGVIAAYDEDLKIIAAIHMAPQRREGQDTWAEISISVDQAYRSQGIAGRLGGRALMWCRARGIKEIDLQWLTHNGAVTKLVKNFGGQIEGQQSEYQSRLRLDDPHFVDFFREAYRQYVEQIQFSLGLNRRLIRRFQDRYFHKSLAS